ncbi:unnamed protein product [Thlaspi arvense]|uniref:RING-type E3 ubiquitin transferase n=1 Tax=Thlaspi arvense TaxID=13288 RepID=A0AAU9SQC2_THLAR|nr:unnamed protein product [Thlaspi arvense]
MTICQRIVICVVLPLFLFQFLPYVTSQQESVSANRDKKNKLLAKSVVGIMLLVFLLSIIGGYLFRTSHGAEIEAGGREGVKGLKIGKGGVECAICLNEFEDEEPLRWMPPCSHTFHASCIDVWLSSRSTCPVCRADLSFKPGDISDLETGNGQTCVLESQDDISLMSNSVTWNNNANYITPRSRSTGLLSKLRMAEIFVPRSRSTGHSLVRFGENLDRFTLQLPEEVSFNLIRRSHMALPKARSSREGRQRWEREKWFLSGTTNASSGSLFLFSNCFCSVYTWQGRPRDFTS